MKNKVFIQYKKERFVNLPMMSGIMPRPNKVESLRCNSIERAQEIVLSRNQQNVKNAFFYDKRGEKTKLRTKGKSKDTI